MKRIVLAVLMTGISPAMAQVALQPRWDADKMVRENPEIPVDAAVRRCFADAPADNMHNNWLDRCVAKAKAAK